MSENKLESVIIVKGEHGSVGTIRFGNSAHDRIISSSNNSQKSKEALYVQIEQHVAGVLNG